jgi:predicted phage terminase large subunit-like protein
MEYSAEYLLELLKNNAEIRGIYSAVCKKDFKSYILLMFFLINGSKYKLKPFHNKVMKALQDLVEGKNTKRNLALCLPVGSGKSLLVEYFITWCFARSVDNAFCYVAFSDRLITKLSKESKDIIESDAFKLLFNHYLKKDDRQKINYSFQGAKNRTGLTAGTLNSALTGLDVGNPNVEGFSGALIVDDPMSADEAVFPNARETVVRVYDEKLATRRRTAHAPTILIMQRLHVDDLVGWTKQTEPDEWEYVEVPALDENNNSFWEERYPAKDLIKMRDTNMYKFQAQYQQNPIIAGGQMIKSEWFQFYQSHPKYERIFIASDTAMKTGQHNDFSVFMVWGVFQHSIYLIDMLRGKWEAPELLKNIRMLTSQYMLWENRLKASALYIEDKASGVGLVQQLKRESRLPVIPITVTKDKVTRVEEVLPTLEAGRVFLPFDRNYGHNPQIIGECELFARDMSHSHDDIVDTLVHSINVSVGFGRTFSIFET